MTEPRKKGMEKRRWRRHQIVEPVQICDRVSQCWVGRLVNIHTQGLMVMGKYPFREESICQLDLHLPEPVNGRTVINLQADCLWAREAEAQVCWAGFRILDISKEAAQDIQSLIERFALYEDRELFASAGGPAAS